jgi:hypothetical protein
MMIVFNINDQNPLTAYIITTLLLLWKRGRYKGFAVLCGVFFIMVYLFIVASCMLFLREFAMGLSGSGWWYFLVPLVLCMLYFAERTGAHIINKLF